MWSYYGAKTNVVHHYPPPKHSKIIEPFAGTARYALRYFDREILLVDKYDVIIRIWKWLQQCSPGDILGLPRFKEGENINNYRYDCEEQRLLIGFLVGFGFSTPRDTAIPRFRNRPNAQVYTMNKIASNLWKIKHWEFLLASYENLKNESATYFIDPPYQFGGHCYKESNKNINYGHLSKWCKSRSGQVIVCENTKANWLDFRPFVNQQCNAGQNFEAIWLNEPSQLDNKQLSIFN